MGEHLFDDAMKAQSAREYKEALRKEHKAFLDKIDIYREINGDGASFVSCMSFGEVTTENSIGCNGSIEDMFCNTVDIIHSLYEQCNTRPTKCELIYHFLKALSSSDFVGLDLLEVLLKRLRAEQKASEKDLPGLPRWEDVSED